MKNISNEIFDTKNLSLNDFESLQDAYSKDCCQARPKDNIFNIFVKKGWLVSWSGSVWREQRRFSLKTLRNLGFGRKTFDEKISEEIDYLSSVIDSFKSEAVRVREFLGPSVSNVISQLVIGERYAFKDPNRKAFDQFFELEGNEGAFRFTTFQSYYIPFIRIFTKFLTVTRMQTLQLEFDETLRTIVQSKWDSFDSSKEPVCFIDAYIQKINDENSDESYSCKLITFLISSLIF